MVGYIWLFLIFSSVVIGGINGKISEVSEAAISSAKLAVEISISLIGIMALWLGIMKIAEASGLIFIISKLIRPVAEKLFPDIPKNHPAIGNMVMNFSANALGLTNAATPMGIKAMKELQSLNPEKSTATNSMCTFLVVNTAGFQLIPASIIAVLASTGSKNPASIVLPILLATGVTLIFGLISVKILEKLSVFSKRPSKIELNSNENTKDKVH